MTHLATVCYFLQMFLAGFTFGFNFGSRPADCSYIFSLIVLDTVKMFFPWFWRLIVTSSLFEDRQ